MEIADAPIQYDWGATVALAGAGAGVVAVVTLLSMPVLWQLMKPSELRVE